MSSTDDAALRRFFQEKLVPAAEALRGRGVRFFPLGPDAADTAWEAAPDEPDFVVADEAGLAAALRERWEGQGLPELAALAEPLLELSRGLEVAEEETPDISPFVYVMY